MRISLLILRKVLILHLHLGRMHVERVLGDHVIHLEVAHVTHGSWKTGLILGRNYLRLKYIGIGILELLLGVVHHKIRLKCIRVFHFLYFLANHLASTRSHKLLEFFIDILGVIIFDNFS